VLSSSYPGAIRPVQLLQLQRQHVSRPACVADEKSLFYNCTTPKHKVPPAPLHHTLELQDQVSLRSATAPAHVHQGWHGRAVSGSIAGPPPPSAITAESPNWRQGSSTISGESEDLRRRQGRVKWYNQQKKYGFIISQDSKEYFVHRDDLKPINTILEPQLYTGEYVEYDPMPTQDGRLKASNVSGIKKGPLMCDHAKRPL